MKDWFNTSTQYIDGLWVVNIQMLSGNKRNLIEFMHTHRDRLVDVITWDKGFAAPAMAAACMSSRFEWLLIYSNNSPANRIIPMASWRGTVQNLYDAPRQQKNEFAGVHLATMPVHLPTWIMQTVCDEAKTVYEPFTGTGTTMLAAEQLGRPCYGMEISPAYCDIAVERWENLTGKKAERHEAVRN